ncbi:MAG: DUF4115 domain-containing protein [Mariprofundaceae bacterium]|nr:DUF4115 domain-containing protein [Mariprofundaceae bacterium]
MNLHVWVVCNMTSEDNNANEPETISKEDILLEVGELLKSEREKSSTSIDTVANALNLRKIYLNALEAGDWTDMPGEVYALGFLRQYADYLHLDLSQSIEKLKSGHYHLTKPLTFPDPPIAPQKSWMVFAALAFIALFVGFNVFDHTPPAPLPSQLMQDAAVHMQKDKNSIVINEKIEASTKESSTVTAIATTLPSNKGNALKPTIKTKGIDAKKISSYNYKLTAVTADVWLQLHDSNEPPALVREALLKKGESMQVTSPKPLRLTSGNALSLKIILNKQTIIQVNQLGEKGKVLHNYLLQKKEPLP